MLRQRFLTALRLGRAVRLVWHTAPWWTLANSALVVVQGALPLASLLVVKRIVDAATAGVVGGNRAALAPMIVWVAIGGCVALLAAFTRLVGEYVTEGQGLQVTDAVADILHAQSVAVDLEYYEQPAYYDTLHRAQREAPYRPTRIVNGLVQLGQNGLALVGIAAWIVALNWLLAVVLFAAAVPGAVGRLIYSRLLFGLDRNHTEQERRAWYYHSVLSDLAHAKELRLFDLGALFQARYREMRQAIRTDRLGLARRRLVFDLFAQALAVLALFGSLSWVAVQTVRGAVTLGDLVVYYLGLQTALTLLQTALRTLAGLYEDNLFLTNLYAFLDIVPTIVAPRRPQPVPSRITNGVVFRGVDFKYPGNTEDTLHDINMSLAPGEVVALVGENGSGKTTLVKLLCRLYDPSHGTMAVDGIDAKQFDPLRWRRAISVLFQDYARYSLSVAENIWLGDITMPPDLARIADAGSRAGAATAIGRLPRGYDTPLGRWFRGGHELSEGEWQKIGLARAFWRDASILILDEPSSALDPLAEADMVSRFRQLLDGRSAVVISHRLSTVQLADRIYVMDHGHIVESGTHAALLASRGRYAQLYQAQAQHYQAGEAGGR